MSKAREIIDNAAFEFQNIDSFFNNLFLNLSTIFADVSFFF